MARTFVAFNGWATTTGLSRTQAAERREAGIYVTDIDRWARNLRKHGPYVVGRDSTRRQSDVVTRQAAMWAARRIDGAYAQRVKTTA